MALINIGRDNDDIQELRGNSVGNINNEGWVASDDKWIYSRNQFSGLYKELKKGGSRQRILDVWDPGYINVVDGWIYYTNVNGIHRIRTDGLHEQTVSNDSICKYVTVVDGWIYYCAFDVNPQDPFDGSSAHRCYKIKIDGVGKMMLSKDSIHTLTVVNGWVYYTSHLDFNLYRMRTDGSEKQNICNYESYDGHFCIVGDWAYYSSATGIKGNKPRFIKVKIDGSARQTLFDFYVGDFNIIEDYMYYIVKDNDWSLCKIRLDGYGHQILDKQAFSLRGVVNNWIYYTDTDRTPNSDKKFFLRIRTDGTGRQELVYDVSPSDEIEDNIQEERNNMARTLLEFESVPRKKMVVIFIVDTSANMAGQRIEIVNAAVEQTLEKIREMNADNDDAEIEVAILEFSTGARWLTPNGLVKPENIYWSYLAANEFRGCDMGEAFRMLEEKLHRGGGFMQGAYYLYYAPKIFLFSATEPTDDYKPHLEKLHHNLFFRKSIKVAIPIGDETNVRILEEFTGTKEAVIRVADGNIGEKLAKMVCCIEYEDDDDDEYYLVYCHYCGESYMNWQMHDCLTSKIYKEVPDDNTLWQALKRVNNECGEDIFSNPRKFKSALADFLAGVGQDIVRLRKRTVEAVELGVYKRLRDAEQSDLDRVVLVEVKKLQDEGINEATAQEIVYALARFFLKRAKSKQEQIQDVLQAAVNDDDYWNYGGGDDDLW